MISFLRFVGVMNAAVWLGASLYHLLAVGPFFSTAAARWVLGEPQATGAGLMLWHRLYTLQYLCVGVAWAHLLTEWVYLGRGPSRFQGWMLSLMLTLTLAGDLELRHGVEPAHWTRLNAKANAEEKARAQRNYPLWSALWMSTQAGLTLAVILFSSRTLMATPGPRFMTQGKFRTPDSLDP